MRIVVLGCGASAGVPLIGGPDGRGDWGACDPNEPRNRRTRAGIVIESQAGQRLLIDTPPELRGQLLACAIPRVDAILFTHAHADHITGLDDVRILNRIAGRPLPAYAEESVLAELARRFDYVFQPWDGRGFLRPVLETNSVFAGETIRIAGMDVRLFDQDHGFTHTLGLRIGGFAYSTDVRGLDEAAFAALAGIDTWIVGCFQRSGPHATHAHLDKVLGWVARLAPRRTILTHMGSDMDWAWLLRNLPAGVEPGYDGLVVRL
ncbi:MAG TPA: MBL fold metallo-hydrolase [Acetobacteraceae bacterium]|nr:MBL fold metallo-hydrolase [Acetobacteraceae bacterium]